MGWRGRSGWRMTRRWRCTRLRRARCCWWANRARCCADTRSRTRMRPTTGYWCLYCHGHLPKRLHRLSATSAQRCARHLSSEIANIITADLWPAVERDDIATFAQALTRIQELNHATLARAGQPATLTPQEQTILDIMRHAGALTAGQTLAGLGLYGLIEGGGPSRELRRILTERLGYFGGTVMASICDNTGALTDRRS